MFKRIGNLCKAFINLFIKGAEQVNPEAMLEQEKENVRVRVAKFNEGLAAQVAQAEMLMKQVQDQRDRKKKLERQIQIYIGRNDENTAGKYAIQLEQLEQDLAKNEAQLAGAEETYKKLLRARDQIVGEAEARIQRIKGQLSDMKMKEATAELVQIANDSFTEIGSSADTLNRLESMVNERSAMATGRARVALDSAPQVDDIEEFIEVDEQNALERFKAKQLGNAKPAEKVEVISSKKVETEA